MKTLEGKYILVTGILNRHSIAYAIAKEAAAAGARLVLTYQSSERLKAKVGKLAKEEFADATLLPLDVTSDSELDELFATLAKSGHGLDGIVHSLAFAPREALSGRFEEATTRAAFATALDISAFSLTALAQRARPLLNAQASLVTLTYLGANRAVPNYNVMGVAKAALESSVRYLAASLGGDGHRVNAISAGPIRTLAASGIADINKMLGAVAQQAALKRNITQEEVAHAATFLLSPLASGITGEILHVDAGHNFMLAAAADPA